MNTKNKKQIIIGITGGFGSGKTTASSFFVDKGFTKITLSSFLEKEARKQFPDKPITRELLQDIGNALREKHGSGVLTKKALETIKKEKLRHVVIDGIRNIGEMKELYAQDSFVLLAIVSNRKIRFERLQNLKRREKLTWELFNSLDYRDLGVGEEETGLQAGLCISLADIFVENNGSLESFETKLTEIITELYNKDEI